MSIYTSPVFSLMKTSIGGRLERIVPAIAKILISFQISIGGRGRVDDDDKSWTTEDPPPRYNDIIASPPSYSSNKNIATSSGAGRATTPTISSAGRAATPTLSGARTTTPTLLNAATSSGISLSYSPRQHSDTSRRQLPQIRNYSNGQSNGD